MATLEQLDVTVCTVPLDAPESDGTLTWDATTVVIVEAHGAGSRGFGFSYATRACAAVIADVLRPAVIGIDLLDTQRAWSAMVAATRNLGRPGVVSMAIAAVDIALWDLKARMLDMSLCQLLGMTREAAPIYASGGFTSLTDPELANQLGGWVHDQGIPRVKMKVGTTWGRYPSADVERVGVAREAIGPAAELFVDANGGYSRKQAVWLAAAFADQGVTWFEEPVSSDDLTGLAQIRAGTPVEIAAGGYGYDLVYFRRMVAAGAVDVVQADVSRCAGITEWLRVAAVAAAHGLEVSGHCAPSLHAHPACAIPNLRHLEYFADHVRVDHLLFDGVLEPVDGTLQPDLSRPGMGLDLKRAELERFGVTS